MPRGQLWMEMNEIWSLSLSRTWFHLRELRVELFPLLNKTRSMPSSMPLSWATRVRSKTSWLQTVNASSSSSTKRYLQSLVMTERVGLSSSRWRVTTIGISVKMQETFDWKMSSKKHWQLTKRQTTLNCRLVIQSSLVSLSTSLSSIMKWWRTTPKHASLLIKLCRRHSTRSMSLKRMISAMPRVSLSYSRKISRSGRKKRITLMLIK